MSSHTYGSECPNCGDEMELTTETRPYERTWGLCYECGFHFYPHEAYMPLEALNQERADSDLPPLAKLPTVNYLV